MLSETSQTKTNTIWYCTYIWNLEKKIELRNIVEYWGCGSFLGLGMGRSW